MLGCCSHFLNYQSLWQQTRTTCLLLINNSQLCQELFHNNCRYSFELLSLGVGLWESYTSHTIHIGLVPFRDLVCHLASVNLEMCIWCYASGEVGLLGGRWPVDWTAAWPNYIRISNPSTAVLHLRVGDDSRCACSSFILEVNVPCFSFTRSNRVKELFYGNYN